MPCSSRGIFGAGGIPRVAGELAHSGHRFGHAISSQVLYCGVPKGVCSTVLAGTTQRKGWVMTAAATSPDAFRLRLLDGLAASITEKGVTAKPQSTTIVRHARTSKRTLLRPVRKQGRLLHRTAVGQQHVVGRPDPHGGGAGHRLAGPDRASRRGLCRSHRVGARGHAELDPRTARARHQARPLQRAALRELTDLLIELSDSAGFRHAELPQLTRPMAIILLGGLRGHRADRRGRSRHPRDL